MSVIPLHIQRRFEQRWALRFGSLIPDVSKTDRKAHRSTWRGAWQKPKKNPPDRVGGRLFLRLVKSLSEGGK